MKLVFEGRVRTGDWSRISICLESRRHDQPDGHAALDCPELQGRLWIGDRYVVSEVESAKWNGHVQCVVFDGTLANIDVKGVLKIQEGYGMSEVSPMDSDELFVGPHDLLEIIGNMEGRDVTVWFADEPINVFEGVSLTPSTSGEGA